MATRSHRACCDKADAGPAPGAAFDVPRPLSAKFWIDDSGAEWHRRGAAGLTPKQARRLLAGASRVMHVRGGVVHEHLGADRQGLVGDIEDYWSGRADPMVSFEFGEFRDDDRSVMGMVVEGC